MVEIRTVVNIDQYRNLQILGINEPPVKVDMRDLLRLREVRIPMAVITKSDLQILKEHFLLTHHSDKKYFQLGYGTRPTNGELVYLFGLPAITTDDERQWFYKHPTEPFTVLSISVNAQQIVYKYIWEPAVPAGARVLDFEIL